MGLWLRIPALIEYGNRTQSNGKCHSISPEYAFGHRKAFQVRCGSLRRESLPNTNSVTALAVNDYHGLKSLPPLPSSLTMLIVQTCSGLKSLPLLPRSLNHLSVDNCPAIKTPIP
jgi:hypothetical protein